MELACPRQLLYDRKVERSLFGLLHTSFCLDEVVQVLGFFEAREYLRRLPVAQAQITDGMVLRSSLEQYRIKLRYFCVFQVELHDCRVARWKDDLRYFMSCFEVISCGMV